MEESSGVVTSTCRGTAVQDNANGTGREGETDIIDAQATTGSKRKRPSGSTVTGVDLVERVPRTLQRFRALILKRLLYLWRTPFLLITGWIIPIAIAGLSNQIFYIYSLRKAPEESFTNLSTILSEGSAESPARTFIGEPTAGDNNSLSYRFLLDSQNITYDIFTDVLSSLRAKYNEDYFGYLSTYAFGSVFNKTV
ncbi:hypothetical protein HPB50_011265 [Hyalomma asiaticum]|uniref:Uncharacterized protein n=1 Tax=Hyalomma asiaticum TaxID=266040 RepID=A0ACB7S5L3_HYAAI|nr:hypothetical protein HPB50_011265 [Hyalomma asiaticum]